MEGLKPCQFRQVDPQGRILCNVIKGGDREVSVNLCRACPVAQINCQHLRAGLEKKVSTPITVRFATGRVEVWDDAPPTIDFKQAACAAKTMPIQSPRDCAGCPIRQPNIIPQNAIQVAHRSKAGTSAAMAAEAVAQPAARPDKRATRVAQPAAVAPVAPIVAQAQAAAPQAISAPAGIDLGAANDLIARAKATAARKAQEKEQKERERAAREQQERLQAQLQSQVQAQSAPPPEAKSKIIQIQDWLAGQINKKQERGQGNSLYKPQPVTPDADGVSDIIYSPLGMKAASAYQEVIDYERCVGWTD